MLTKILSYFLILFINTNFSYQSFAQPNTKNSNDHLISSLKKLKLNGRFDFDNTSNVAYDFGNRFHYIPLAILFPKTVSDISTTIKYVYKKSRRFSDQLTVTARGHGHSLEGQSQNEGGIVISMESLEEPRFFVHIGEDPYVDALGGELWINVLYESIKYGLTPKSWTDFLYLSVGGTLSNGGISGEAFKHGPQINSSNVYQLEVVTGKGDIVNCSQKQNADLFYGVLGGLGQFGIITKARISLQVAPKLVKWIKVLYSEFNLFTKDQENLISQDDTFDYIEGFVLTNVESNMTTNSSGKTLYGLEVAKFFNPDEKDITNKKIDEILGKLNYLSHTFLESEVTYVEFLDRLHVLPELMVEDRSNVANLSFPWLNLLVPKSSILTFGEEVFTHILSNITYSPILIYPFNQSRWKDKTSMVTPEEDVIYLVAFLTSAKTYSSGLDGLDNMLTINKKILDFLKKENLGVKQYLPYHDTLDEWKNHFGKRWDVFSRRKKSYDPLSILSPKQRIFQRGQTIS